MINFFSNFAIFQLPILILVNVLLILFMNIFFLKKKFLIDNKDFSSHKKFINLEVVPLTGGFVLLIDCLFFNLLNSFANQILIIAIFVLGMLSDIQRLNSPIKRLIIQILIVVIFVYSNELFINSIRITPIDNYLDYKIFSVIFTSFCLLILMNGSNFIDGINLQCSGYFFSILTILLYIDLNIVSIINLKKIYIIYSFLISFIFFNFFNKSYLGDAGTYLLSLVCGSILIKFQINSNISPYFIVLLLWYPAFENFFSIIRKFFVNKKRPDQPDLNHLHHLIFDFLNKKFIINRIFLSSLTGIIINSFNLFIFYIGTQYLYDTKILVILILFCVILYFFIYSILSKNYKI